MADATPGSPEPEKFPDWVLFYRVGRTHCYADADAAAAAVANDATSVAVDTSNNQSGYFSFTLRDPSKVSYLNLHWPYGESTHGLPAAIPSTVSSDENLLLLRIAFTHSYIGPDLFVYTADHSSPPSLRRLPACPLEPRGLAGRVNFSMVDSNVGILCRGGDPSNYVVADLAVSWRKGDNTNPPVKGLMLCTFSSKKGDWTAKEMLPPQLHGQDRFPDLWSCDRVLAFAGRFLCWVDYYSGIVFCDFSDEDSTMLHHVPVPGNQQYSDKILIERYCPELFRNVSVSQGMMCFVQIGNDWWQPSYTSGLTITIWNLLMVGDRWNWEIHGMINFDELYLQHSYKGLPFPPVNPPEFPVVTKDNPDVVCYIMRGPEDEKVWIVNVDMKHKLFQSVVRYINEQIDFNEDDVDAVEYESYFGDAPLLPSDISRYLNKSSPGLASEGDKFETHPAKRSKLAF